MQIMWNSPGLPLQTRQTQVAMTFSTTKLIGTRDWSSISGRRSASLPPVSVFTISNSPDFRMAQLTAIGLSRRTGQVMASQALRSQCYHNQSPLRWPSFTLLYKISIWIYHGTTRLTTVTKSRITKYKSRGRMVYSKITSPSTMESPSRLLLSDIASCHCQSSSLLSSISWIRTP